MQVLIVGAGYAGLEAALRLSRKAQTISVTLVNPSPHFRERIRDHEWVAGARPRIRPLEQLLHGTGVRLVVGKVDTIDRRARTAAVTLAAPGPDGATLTLPWDYLILATGSVTQVSTPGVAQFARTLDGEGAGELAAQLRALATRGGKVVVVGGGLTGVELATEIAEKMPALAVEVVTSGEVGEGFSEAARRAMGRSLSRLSVGTRPHEHVVEVEDSALIVKSGSIPFDLCIWATGFSAPPLPEGLDLPLDARGRVLVREDLVSVSDPRVFGAGDVASIVGEKRLALPSGCKTAGPAGLQVADNILLRHVGQKPRPFRFEVPLYCLSLGRKDGIVQRVSEDGSPTGWVLTGRLGAVIKELICRSTLWALWLERKPRSRYLPETSPRLPAGVVEGQRS